MVFPTYFAAAVLLLLVTLHQGRWLVDAFGVTSRSPRRYDGARGALHVESSSSSSSSSSSFSYTDQDRLERIFPVLSRIHGINWQGSCRYVNAELQPQTNLLLTGGTRYDLQLNDDEDDSEATCTMTSFLTFPNGNTRQVQMVGTRGGSFLRPGMRLDPVSEEGPIYMVLTELPPDTILLNEIDKATGKTILTASISIPTEGDEELIQVSHEVGNKDVPIEGHQVWRLKRLEFE